MSFSNPDTHGSTCFLPPGSESAFNMRIRNQHDKTWLSFRTIPTVPVPCLLYNRYLLTGSAVAVTASFLLLQTKTRYINTVNTADIISSKIFRWADNFNFEFNKKLKKLSL